MKYMLVKYGNPIFHWIIWYKKHDNQDQYYMCSRKSDDIYKPGLWRTPVIKARAIQFFGTHHMRSDYIERNTFEGLLKDSLEFFV